MAGGEPSLREFLGFTVIQKQRFRSEISVLLLDSTLSAVWNTEALQRCNNFEVWNLKLTQKFIGLAKVQ